jgi:putative hemolysin
MTGSRILSTTVTPLAPRYSIIVASTDDEIIAAQRLRYRVFAEELGADLHSTRPGLDADDFDEFCDHLLVRDDTTGDIVGTYRMLPPHRAAAAGRLYSDSEFDLARFAPLRDILVETGRSCVHPDHRNGAVINLMWTGIARYLHLHGHRWLAGCASVPIAKDSASGPLGGPTDRVQGATDGDDTVDRVWELANRKHLAPPALRVTPRVPFPVRGLPDEPRAALLAAVPPLLRGYLRLGAWICGEPAHDPDFKCADFLVLLSLDRVDPRYLKHFLGETT